MTNWWKLVPAVLALVAVVIVAAMIHSPGVA